jgi:putative redox protein
MKLLKCRHHTKVILLLLILSSHGKDYCYHYNGTLSHPAYPGTNTLIADEPKDSGGGDEGFSPSDLVAASLGTCTCITLRMYADRKGWPLEGVQTEVTFTRDSDKNESFFKRIISLSGNLSIEQKQRLLQIANGCYIHKVLTNPIHVLSELKE